MNGSHGPFTLTRPRLDQRLAGSGHRRLTCVVAGAGFGKTTLLTAWAATATTSAWHSLTSGDRALGGGGDGGCATCPVPLEPHPAVSDGGPERTDL